MRPSPDETPNQEKPPSARFIEGENDTIIDRVRKLVWLKKDTWQIKGKWMSWVQVREFAEELNREKRAGFENWRMPTAAEAKSLNISTEKNKDHMGQVVSHAEIFTPGFGFLCWTGDVRDKIQAVRFGFRKGAIMYDDIYRTSRGSSRLVRDIEKGEDLIERLTQPYFQE